AQPAEQALAVVGQRLQPGEAEEAARALDGVDGAEDAVEQFPVARGRLQGHQVAVELLEVLAALEQELLDQVLVVHGRAPLSRSPAPAGSSAAAPARRAPPSSAGRRRG